MQCKLLRPGRTPNPAFDRAEMINARRAGKQYDEPRDIELPAGTVIDDPQAWMHCCPGVENSEPIAEPVDDECRDRVRHFMQEVRPGRLKQLKMLAGLPRKSFKSDKQYEWIQHLARTYGLVDGEPSPVSPANTADRASGK